MAFFRAISPTVELSDQKKYDALHSVFPDQRRNFQFKTLAVQTGWLSQREADQKAAGREFRHALDWIRWTEETKGETSRTTCYVKVKSRGSGQLERYTQTWEYHMSGARNNVFSENTPSRLSSRRRHEVQGQLPEVFQGDKQRAELLEEIVDRIVSMENANSMIDANQDVPWGEREIKDIRARARWPSQNHLLEVPWEHYDNLNLPTESDSHLP